MRCPPGGRGAAASSLCAGEAGPPPTRERLARHGPRGQGLSTGASSLSARGATLASMPRARLESSGAGASRPRARRKPLLERFARHAPIARDSLAAIIDRFPTIRGTRRALRNDHSAPAPPPRRRALSLQSSAGLEISRGRRQRAARSDVFGSPYPAERPRERGAADEPSRYIAERRGELIVIFRFPARRTRERSALGPALSSARHARRSACPLRHWRLLQC